MSIASALARGRQAAETLMVDACVIDRPTGEATGPGGVISTTYGPVLYSGKCRMQVGNQESHGTDVGEAYRIVSRPQLQLPMTVTGLREGDRVRMTAAALDQDLVGKVYVIRDVMSKTHLTARRVTLFEVTS